MAENSYEIYQLKNNKVGHDLLFMNTDYLKKKGQKVNSENYDLIYNAPLEYADLILNGDPDEYLKTVTEYKSLD